MSAPLKPIDKNVIDVSRQDNASSRAIREFRTKLAITGPSSRAYLIDRLKTYTDSQPALAFMQLLFCLTVTAFAHSHLETYELAIGLPIIGIAVTMSAVVAKKFQSKEVAQEDAMRWLMAFAFFQLVVCAGLCAFVWQSCHHCTGNEPMLLKFIATIGFVAIVSATTFPFMALSIILILPPSLVLAARLGLDGWQENAGRLAVIAATTAFFGYVIHVLRRSMAKRFEETTEKHALLAEMETQKSIANSARIRAEEANLAKSRFLATMSHELRTPLNAILGFSGMMKDEILGPIDNDKYREYVDDIHNSGSHLLHVINDILDISRIEAGKHELNEEKLNLVKIIDDARRLMEVKAREKNISFETRMDERLPTVWVDRKAVRQITLNLLSNAIKFTPTNGRITIKVGWTSGGGQYLSIRDTGPGIPEKEIPVILSSFGQGSIAIHSAEQGTGLGLTIVQALLDLHQGRFELKSKLREGTEVIAFFPKERVSVTDQVRQDLLQSEREEPDLQKTA